MRMRCAFSCVVATRQNPVFEFTTCDDDDDDDDSLFDDAPAVTFSSSVVAGAAAAAAAAAAASEAKLTATGVSSSAVAKPSNL